MNTSDMLTYVRDIGALGGTLTLEYNAGIFTLTGDELIFSADDYDMSDPFSIVEEPEENLDIPWELENAVVEEPYVPGDFAKFVVVGTLLTGFAFVLALLT